MDQAKMITIQQTRRSQSGKSLGVQDKVDMRWYNTKAWELETMVGQTIYAQTSESEWQGRPQYWINDYTMPEGQAAAPPNVPPQYDPLHGAGTGPARVVDRDASIVAQVLCKTVTFSTVDAAFYAYIAVYEMVREWQVTGRTPEAEHAGSRANEPLNDDIPF